MSIFSFLENAKIVLDELSNFKAKVYNMTTSGGTQIFRVLIGPYDDVNKLINDLKDDTFKKYEDLSPVNTLPVLLPPCAAGANPTKRILPFISPNPVIGLPQYF